MLDYCFFVVKQKTAYEVRISDWSSDVCSSDLGSRYRPQDAGDASRMAWDCQWSLLRCRGRDPRLHDAGTSPSHLRCWSERLRGAMVTAPRPPAITSEVRHYRRSRPTGHG